MGAVPLRPKPTASSPAGIQARAASKRRSLRGHLLQSFVKRLQRSLRQRPLLARLSTLIVVMLSK